jgi:hypothetical protein
MVLQIIITKCKQKQVTFCSFKIVDMFLTKMYMMNIRYTAAAVYFILFLINGSVNISRSVYINTQQY